MITTHQTTGSHVEALTAKKVRSIRHLKPHSFTTLARRLPFPEKISKGPRLLNPAPLTKGRWERLQ